MDITIGTIFYKMVDKKQVECIVVNFFEAYDVCMQNGEVFLNTIFFAKENKDEVNEWFEVPMATIVRGLIK